MIYNIWYVISNVWYLTFNMLIVFDMIINWYIDLLIYWYTYVSIYMWNIYNGWHIVSMICNMYIYIYIHNMYCIIYIYNLIADHSAHTVQSLQLDATDSSHVWRDVSSEPLFISWEATRLALIWLYSGFLAGGSAPQQISLIIYFE